MLQEINKPIIEKIYTKRLERIIHITFTQLVINKPFQIAQKQMSRAQQQHMAARLQTKKVEKEISSYLGF